MIALTFVFAATQCQGWPRIRIAVDSDVLIDHEFVSDQESVTVDLDVTDGTHTLEIERWGKQSINVRHEDGKILEDQTVTLHSIWAQDVRLPDWFVTAGNFHWQQGIIEHGMTWGPNGVYKLPFQAPLISWILAEKTRRWPEIISLFPPTAKNCQRLNAALDEFEQDLQRVSV